MTTRYLDTSAAMKLVVEEAESAALAAHLDAVPSDRVVASWLLHTELHCAARQHPAAFPGAAVSAVLDRLVLVDLDRVDLLSASTIGAGLRSQDAIHLAVAHRLAVDAVVTYDAEQAAAAVAAGIAVEAPA